MTTLDEGGEAPCFAHLQEGPPQHTYGALTELL